MQDQTKDAGPCPPARSDGAADRTGIGTRIAWATVPILEQSPSSLSSCSAAERGPSLRCEIPIGDSDTIRIPQALWQREYALLGVRKSPTCIRMAKRASVDEPNSPRTSRRRLIFPPGLLQARCRPASGEPRDSSRSSGRMVQPPTRAGRLAAPRLGRVSPSLAISWWMVCCLNGSSVAKGGRSPYDY